MFGRGVAVRYLLPLHFLCGLLTRTSLHAVLLSGNEAWCAATVTADQAATVTMMEQQQIPDTIVTTEWTSFGGDFGGEGDESGPGSEQPRSDGGLGSNLLRSCTSLQKNRQHPAVENVLPVWYSTPGTDTGYSATRSGPGVCTAGQLLHLPTRSVRLSGTDKAYENSKLLRLFGTATAYDGTKVPETLVRKTVRGVGCGTDALYHGLPCRPHRSLSSKGCRSTMRSQILFRAELRTPEPKVLGSTELLCFYVLGHWLEMPGTRLSSLHVPDAVCGANAVYADTRTTNYVSVLAQGVRVPDM
eukprot:1940994-Rhodomonas_salina.1